MPGTSSSGANEPIEPADNILSNVTRQLSFTADDSDKISTPPKNFSDMPFDVVGLIIERSDYREQLILRKTSNALRELVDKQQPSCRRLIVSCKSNWITCHYNDHCVVYASPFWNQDGIDVGYENQRFDTILKKDDFEHTAFDDLASTLKNPKLQLEYFSFVTEKIDDYEGSFESEDDMCFDVWNNFGDMKNIPYSINHQLSVKACRIDVSNYSTIMSILPYLKPGVLEKITIQFYLPYGGQRNLEWYFDRESMEQVALLDQWKQAKELALECEFDDEFLTEHGAHFKRFLFNELFIYRKSLVSIRNYILKHENAEFCTLLGVLQNDDLQSVVGTQVSPNSSHYSIPNSDDYLEFVFTKNLITIEKKKKQ